jgi:hypothetical protein
LRWQVGFDSFPEECGEGVGGVFSPVPRKDRLFFAGVPALFFAGFFAGLSCEPGASAAEFFELAERPLALLGEAFLLGMAMFFRVEESHHGAVERVAMMRAETVAGPGATQATMPGWSRGARWHEGDAAGHGRRDEMRKAKFEKGKLKIEIR